MMEFADCLNYLQAHEQEIELAAFCAGTAAIAAWDTYMIYTNDKFIKHLFKEYPKNVENCRAEIQDLPPESRKDRQIIEGLVRKYNLLPKNEKDYAPDLIDRVIRKNKLDR